MDDKETGIKDEIDTIDIIPKKINIMVETNIEGEAPFPLTYDKIYNPVKSSTLPQPKNPDYPYFVSNVKYSEKVLTSYLLKDYSFILLSFFDKKYFSNMIQDFSKEEKPKEGKEHVNHNIFLTLLFLFPMRYPRPANINTSYTKYICKDGNQEYTELTNIYQSGKNTGSVFLRNMRDIETSVREYSYVNTSKGEATVTQIVWLNDVLNNPKYRELIDLLIQYESWIKNKKTTIKNEIDTAITDLIESSDIDKNKITDDDIKLIENQQNITYSKTEFIKNIFEKVKEYIYYDGNPPSHKELQILENIEKKTNDDADNPVKKYIDNPSDDIKNAKIEEEKLVDIIFEVIFDTNSKPDKKNTRYINKKFKLVVMDYLKPIDQKIPKISLKDVELNVIITKDMYQKTDIKTKNIDNQEYSVITGDYLYKLKEKLYADTKFEQLKKQLIKNIKNYVDRYNQNTVRSSSISNKNLNLFIDIDIRIKKAVEELKALNKALKELANDENFKKIVNAVDSLKTFFTEQSIKENRLTGVSIMKQKFENILKKTNIIKTLKYIQENIINSNGINLNYKSESNEFNTVLKSELEKEKYSYFMNTVETINKNFLNIQTTNQNLENIIKDYFNNRNRDLITNLIEPAKTAMNVNKIDDECKYHYMETGVFITTSSAKKLYEYEINIYMEVVIGKVDYKTQNNIKCDYRDEKLVAYFNRDSTTVNKFEIVKSKAINLNNNNKPNNKIQNNKNNANNKKNMDKMKGGKSRRKKKYLQYNKRYTSKRR
uniref:Uncharacterized protein n=1 Tax=viral metagenome TaxID=1070528 RepID=A0A6C0ETK2_9ZZZZ